MAEPQVIVSRTVSIDLPPARELERTVREQGLEVSLDDGRNVRLPSDVDKGPAYAQVLATLQRLRMPVYLEVDPASETISLVRVPDLGRVTNVREMMGGLEVELDSSHARFRLNRDTPNFDRIAQVLREAERGRRRPLILTSDDRTGIIDARFFEPGPDEGPLPDIPIPPKFERPPWDLLLGWRWWPIWPWNWWFGCVSSARARQVFDAMSATSCAPLTVPPPCIPFLYPDDGCWARAHEMCRLMIGMGLSPRKVWIQGSLHTPTRNNPACFVNWGWHVAPTLCVRKLWAIRPWLWGKERMVIDPSLFTAPVTLATWKSVQGDPNATLKHTGADDYRWGETDPDYSKTADRLAYYRAKLLTRAVNSGPPPYAHCP